ncbi:hypothetical protein [Paracoccus sp. ME4]|uniref:hypothetical protein n=1 Tax=Paracoccus sp. ME4 TaxID=3138066 RepID=UPI00398A99E3
MSKTNPACLILAVPTDRLSITRELGNESVFAKLGKEGSIAALAEAGAWFGPRPHLEQDERFRQIIPYVVLRCDGKYLAYTRGAAGGEDRLHAKISMGFGGHVDIPDMKADEDGMFDLGGTLEGSVLRELQEEIPGIEILGGQWVGLLADNTDAVGRVHVGLIGVWDIKAVPAASGEDAIAELTAMTVEEMIAVKDRLENWSQVLVENLTGL